MRPKQQQKARHDDLFRARLDQIINMKHELSVLADRNYWTWLDKELAVDRKRVEGPSAASTKSGTSSGGLSCPRASGSSTSAHA